MVQKPVIICVDDEKTILEALKEQLTRNFMREYVVETAENGESALELLQELYEEKLEVPVVISDHIMPGMKGDELLKKIYSVNPRIRKILLTGQADADAVGRAVNTANLYRYLSKPWEQQDLTLTVQEAIRSYFQDKTLEEQNRQLKVVNDKLEQKIILFNKYVPNQFLKILHIDLEKKVAEQISGLPPDHIELSQCAERELTVMFADIRSFTNMCESMSASEAFLFINEYLSSMGPIISQHGFIDKFIGDAIMAIYTEAEEAMDAAIDMQKQLDQFNKKLEETGRQSIRVGIGLNTGKLMLGTVGDASRLQTTVIGDAVNLTARTEKLTKDFATKVMITGNTYEKLKDQNRYKLRFLDRANVRGKIEKVDFYEVLDALSNEIAEKKLINAEKFRAGVLAFQEGEFLKARGHFEECLKQYADDQAAQLFLNRINEQIAG